MQNATFARLGGLHRNTFINSPRLLDSQLRLKARPHLRFAGQITGVEGYVESAAIGLLAGRFAAAELLGDDSRTAAADDGVRRLAGAHHRRRGREDIPADERQFRPVSRTARQDARQGPQARAGARAIADLDVWLGAAKAAAE